MNNEKNTNSPAESEELKDVQEVETDEQESANEGKTEEPINKEQKSGKHKNRKSFGEYVKSSKFKHGGIATAFTAGFIVVIVLINVVVSTLTARFPSMNIDMTNQGTNTLSSQSVKVAQAVKYTTDIYIIGTPQLIKSDTSYSQVASLADKFAEKNSKIKVSFVDVDKDPTFAARNSISTSTKLQAGNVIIKTEKRSRVLTGSDFFDQQQDQTTQAAQYYTKVDGALASAISQVNSEILPVAAFETGHSPIYDVTGLKTLLTNSNFEIKDFNSLTDAVPANAQLLIIPAPSSDYTDGELKKLDAFLSNTKVAGSRSLVITFDPSQKAMPKLANFLKEWGIAVKSATFIAETDPTKVSSQYASDIFTQIGTTLALGGQSNYQYVTMPQSCPIDKLFDSQSGVTTYSLATSYATSYLADGKTTDASKAAKASYNTAVLAQKSLTIDNKSAKANVIALGSSVMLDAKYLTAPALGNSKYVVDLFRYGTGTSNNDTGVTINQVQTNVIDISINSAIANVLGIGVFTIIIPVCVLIAGIFVYLRRRHL